MVNNFSKKIFIPLVFAAIAAAAGFYFLYYVHFIFTIIILSISVFTLFVLNVFSGCPWLLANFIMPKKVVFCAIAFTAGLVFGLCCASAGQNNIRLGLPEEKITGIEGILREDPRILSGGNVMVSISLRRCAGDNVRVSSSGDITIFLPAENAEKLREFGRGTRVFAEGKIRSDERRTTFNAVSLHIQKPASAIERMRTGIRLNLIDRLEDKDWGGLSLALLVGIRDNLDSNLTTLYRDAGLSYILALSGMHLAVITALIAFLLKKPLGLRAASIIGACFICIYCFLVGPMPSLNRSAIMYLLGVLTILAALPKKSIYILCLSFLIQLIFTPAAGKTLSFILSYLALLGILITSRQLSSLLNGKIPDFLLQPLSMSSGAFLATAAICSFSFGTIAPIGIIAGLLIIPLTTVFMVVSMIWLLLDIFSVSFILNWLLLWLYRLMELISSTAGAVPGIRANPVIILVLSTLLLITIAVLDYRHKRKLLQIKSFE